MVINILIKRIGNFWRAEGVTIGAGIKLTTIGTGDTPHEAIGDMMISLNREGQKVCINDIKYNISDYLTVKYCAEIGVNTSKPV